MAIRLPNTATALGLALILTASPTMSVAATRAVPAPVNPLAVVSVFATPAAAATLCGNAAAAVATQAPACVLPVVDPVPPPGVPQAAPPPPMVADTSMLPALLVIGGLVAAALLASTIGDDDDDDIDIPVSPV